jgi:hypothetical protein
MVETVADNVHRFSRTQLRSLPALLPDRRSTAARYISRHISEPRYREGHLAWSFVDEVVSAQHFVTTNSFSHGAVPSGTLAAVLDLTM